MRGRLAAYKEAEDLILLGAYRAGANAEVDAALRGSDAIRSFLVQEREEGSDLENTRELLRQALAEGIEVVS